MSIFRDENLSSLLVPRMFSFTKDKNGVVFVQDNARFLINKNEAKQLIDGLTKFVNEVDENEIKEFNNSL